MKWFLPKFLAGAAFALALSGFAAGADGEKPAQPAKKKRAMVGLVGQVDASARTVTLLRMGEGGLREDAIKLTADAKITLDGKEAKLDALPKGVNAELVIVPGSKDGMPPEASEVSLDTGKLVWIVKEANATSVTLLGGGTASKLPDRVLKLTADGKLLLDGKEAKLTELQAGDRVTVTLNADRTAATLITAGTAKKRDGDKP